jgi:hypothetical protein
MLQVCCSKYFSCFKHMLQVFYLDVAYVSHIYCRCFIWILHMFCNGYTRAFLMFQTYVASVSFRCCKSRSSVAHVIVGPSVAIACYSYWARLRACGCGEGASGRHEKWCGHRSRCGPRMDMRRCRNGAVWVPCKAGAIGVGVRMLWQNPLNYMAHLHLSLSQRPLTAMQVLQIT